MENLVFLRFSVLSFFATPFTKISLYRFTKKRSLFATFFDFQPSSRFFALQKSRLILAVFKKESWFAVENGDSPWFSAVYFQKKLWFTVENHRFLRFALIFAMPIFTKSRPILARRFCQKIALNLAVVVFKKESCLPWKIADSCDSL